MNPYFTKYQTILFDLDGTLIDSAASLVAALNKTISEILPKTVPIDETVRQLAGIGSRNLLRHAFEYNQQSFSENDIEQLVPHFMDAYSTLYHDTAPFAGADQLLQDLKSQGKNLILATNKPRRFTPDLIKALNWASLFDGIYCPDDVSHKKPNPAHLLEALKNESLTPENTLMVGDSSADYHAALEANIPIMMACFNGQTPEQFPKANYYIYNY